MRLLSSFLALALSTSTVFAADVSPLSPGAPAGVKRAQMESNTVLFVVLGAGAAAGIAVALASGGSDTPANPAAPPLATVATST